MNRSLVYLTFFLCLLILIRCSSDDSDGDMDETTDETTDEVDPIIFSSGVFIDGAVQGITFITADTTGLTDAEGKFYFVEGTEVEFLIGNFSLGSFTGTDDITPFDISGLDEPSISDPVVRNIAAFLQSLDENNNPDDGITISEATSSAIGTDALDFTIEEFNESLTALIDQINSTTGKSLIVVSPNDAAQHLAASLDMEDDFEVLPRVIQGRQWEAGEYFRYHPTRDEYMFRIGSTLNDVRLLLGGTTGFIMDMTYEGNKLIGTGNMYTDMNEDEPSTSIYDYRNRITSPGYVFDYKDQTFIGHYNYFKIDGEDGKIQGTYKSFLEYDQQRTGQDPEEYTVFEDEVIITGPGSNGLFTWDFKERDDDGQIVADTTMLFSISELNNEQVMIIRFLDTDYLFVSKELSDNGIGGNNPFIPGLLAVKDRD